MVRALVKLILAGFAVIGILVVGLVVVNELRTSERPATIRQPPASRPPEPERDVDVAIPVEGTSDRVMNRRRPADRSRARSGVGRVERPAGEAEVGRDRPAPVVDGWRRRRPGEVEVGRDRRDRPAPVVDGWRRRRPGEVEVGRDRPVQVEDPAARMTLRSSDLPAPVDDRRPDVGSRAALIRDCLDCPVVVVVPAGRFVMGAAASDPHGQAGERPLRQVEVQRFALGRHEVTRAEYAAFVEAVDSGSWPDRRRRGGPSGRRRARGVARSDNAPGGCYGYDASGVRVLDEDASWREPGFAQADDHPVVCVNWHEAQAYVDWLSDVTGEAYRLPSEAEWEYAARAGTTGPWWWDDTRSVQCSHANGADRTAGERFLLWTVAPCSDGAVWTARAGSYPANGFGLHDVAGNVWEWVADCWHPSYAGAPADVSAWERAGDCGRRVFRGGSWYNRPPDLRSTVRGSDAAGLRSDGLGFRVAKSLP